MTADPIVILSYARTPMGSFQGALAGASATELGAAAVGGAVERAGLSGEAIERIYMGCVLPAGLGQAPARQAAIKAGLPTHVEATTVNKMCGSGMQATIFAADALAAGSADLIVAGGMESMTNAPYLSMKHRGGARIGHDRLYDHMYLDGLEDAYEPGKLMGNFAEDTAAEYQFTRGQMDDFAIASLERAQKAQNSGAFDREIVPVEVAGRKGTVTVSLDEQPAKGDADQDSDAQARLLEGRHDHRRQCLVDLRRGRRPGADPGERGRAARTRSGRADRRACRARACPGAVHHRARVRDAQGAGKGRLVGERRRPVRSERGLCLRRDDRDARSRPEPRPAQRPWRRLRAGPPDRRLGRAHPRDLAVGAAGFGREAGHGVALHRRRRGDGDGGRTAELERIESATRSSPEGRGYGVGVLNVDPIESIVPKSGEADIGARLPRR